MNVTFFGPTGNMGTVPMDVPRVGEQVGISGGAFTVAAVRYYIAPGSVNVAVLLKPVTPDQMSEHYQQLSAVQPKNP